MQISATKKRFIVLALIALLVLVGWSIIRNQLSIGVLKITLETPADLSIFNEENKQDVLSARVGSSQSFKLKTGNYNIEAASDSGDQSIVSAVIQRGRTTEVKVDFETLRMSPIIAKSFSAGTLAPISEGFLLASDSSDGAIYKITDASSDLVSPFLVGSKALAYSSSTTGLMYTKQGGLYYFNTSTSPISTRVVESLTNEVDIVYNSITSSFIIRDGWSVYEYTPESRDIRLIGSVKSPNNDTLYSFVASGDKAGFVPVLNLGGEEDTGNISEYPAYIMSIDSGAVTDFSTIGGINSTISPDGKYIGIFSDGFLRLHDSDNPSSYEVVSGGQNYLWTANDSYYFSRGSSLWRFDMNSKTAHKITSIKNGSPSNITLSNTGEIYFTGSNGSELVIYRVPSEKMSSKVPDISFPIRSKNYKIDISYLFSKKPNLVITIYAIVNNSSSEIESYSSQRTRIEAEAKKYLSDLGLDLGDFNLIVD